MLNLEDPEFIVIKGCGTPCPSVQGPRCFCNSDSMVAALGGCDMSSTLSCWPQPRQPEDRVREMTSAFVCLPTLENLTTSSNQGALSNLFANNQVHSKTDICQKKGYSPLAPDQPVQESLSPGQCTAGSGEPHKGLPYTRPGTRCISPKGTGSPPGTPI